MRLQKTVLAACLLTALSACTAGHPPPAYMPDRGGLMEGESVTVKSGQNVYTIAREHNVSMREIIVLNELKAPYEIRPGQTLILPAVGGYGGEMRPPAAAPLAPVEKNALSPLSSTSVSSQPLEPLSAPVSTAPLSSQPPIASQAPTPISSLPPASTVHPVAQAAMPASAPPPAIVADPVQSLNRPSPAQKQMATTSAPAPAAASASSTSEPTSVAMIWPVQGPILRSFGSKGTGVNNDGIDIGAPKSSAVVASAPGTVVYSGDEMKGFGNLVLIRHQGDLVTAYAHLDRVMVKKDSVVAQGDMIGTVGKTGNVSSPQLHFEVRLNGKPIDPAQAIKTAM